MPRRPRLHVPGGHYHVTFRGNHRRDIFFSSNDRQALDDIVAESVERVQARIHAYCWMTNHLHLLVQVGDRPLGELMQRVGSRYARMIQKNLGTTGHLFERRYHALLIDANEYFLELLRYIHLNPVRARIVDHPREYRWSSHRTYLGMRRQVWVTTDFGLGLFSTERARAIQAYTAFVNERLDAPSDPSLYEGHPDEPRILGDDRFIEKFSLDVQVRRPKITLEEIAARVCEELNVSLTEVRSKSQSRSLSRARGLIAARALFSNAACLSEIARFLQRSASATARGAARHADSSCNLANPAR